MSAPVDVLAAVRAYGRECTRDGQQTVGQRVGRTARTRHAFAKVEAALQQAKLRETVAIAELFEAVTAYRKGEYHDPEVESSDCYHERRRKEGLRVDAALRAVSGEARHV